MFESSEWKAPLSVADMLKMARRWWWMFLPPVAIAVVLAIVLTSQATPVYAAESEVIIRTEESANLFPLSDIDMLLRSPSAEAGFLESTEFEVAAANAADSDAQVTVDVGDVNSRVEPSFITFSARANSPELAARVAQAWAETYVELRHVRDSVELNQTIGTLESRLDELEIERQILLETVEAIDIALQTTTDAAEVSILTTQRLVLLLSLIHI